MKRLFFYTGLIGCMITAIEAIGQIASTILPTDRMTDWTIAGQRFAPIPAPIQLFDIDQFGAVADGQTPTGTALQQALNSINPGNQAVIRFGAGTYFFDTPISLPEHVRIEGLGADSTHLLFDLNGAAQHCIKAQGALMPDTAWLAQSVALHDTLLWVSNPQLFMPGDYIYLKYDDSQNMYSNWAYKTGGQIIRIKAIINNQIILHSPLRLDIPMSLQPYIQKIIPQRHVEIACLRVERVDATSSQTSNIAFEYAVDSRIEAVESAYCNFAHIELNACLNITVRDCYLHHAFDYGGGGKAYGTMLHFTTGECLIENTIFEHLRHSMIVQAGANGNVFGYNYSFDPYGFQTIIYTDFVGDIVCHGNYPFLNLWEGNIASFIIVDNSHGANGAYNTFFRNRTTKYGVQVSATTSGNQNFLGLEIPSSNGLYALAGTGHLEYANYHQGTIIPANTTDLIDVSLYRNQPPTYLPWSYFGGIGAPNPAGMQYNAAFDRVTRFPNRWVNTHCGQLSTPMLALKSAQDTIPEGDTLWFTIQADFTNAQTPCWVDLSVSGTAQPATDFTYPDTTIVLAANNNLPLSFALVALTDSLLENPEQIELRASVSSSCLMDSDSLIAITVLDQTPQRTEPLDTDDWQPYIYPNPIHTVLQLHSSQAIRSYQLYTALGISVQQGSLEALAAPYWIPLSDLPAGNYLLWIETAAGLSKGLWFSIR